jgi:hypothetical protein
MSFIIVCLSLLLFNNICIFANVTTPKEAQHFE